MKPKSMNERLDSPGSPAAIKVLVIDDHDVVREGIKRLVAEITPNLVVGEARTPQEALRLLEQQEWNLVVLDITLEGRSGLEVLREIRSKRAKLPVLILSMHSEEQYAVRAFKAGAAGYITKGSTREELLRALKKVLGGGRYISPALAEKVIGRLDPDGDDRPPHEQLSDREFEVLRLIASGKTVTQIAELLCLSDKTISTYRARILEKMNLKTNAELTHYVARNHLLE
jgi:two-component system, NarL family, invasion response regulator UvrY